MQRISAVWAVIRQLTAVLQRTIFRKSGERTQETLIADRRAIEISIAVTETRQRTLTERGSSDTRLDMLPKE